MKIRLLLLTLCLSAAALSAQDYDWKADVMDGSRTGCTTPSKDNVSETLGHFEKGKYVAPNGREFPRKSLQKIMCQRLSDISRKESMWLRMEGSFPGNPFKR